MQPITSNQQAGGSSPSTPAKTPFRVNASIFPSGLTPRSRSGIFLLTLGEISQFGYRYPIQTNSSLWPTVR